jgi:hypothetical protein
MPSGISGSRANGNIAPMLPLRSVGFTRTPLRKARPRRLAHTRPKANQTQRKRSRANGSNWKSGLPLTWLSRTLLKKEAAPAFSP